MGAHHLVTAMTTAEQIAALQEIRAEMVSDEQTIAEGMWTPELAKLDAVVAALAAQAPGRQIIESSDQLRTVIEVERVDGSRAFMPAHPRGSRLDV